MHFLKNSISIDRPIHSVYIHPVNKHQRLTLETIVRRIKTYKKGKK